MNSTLSKDSVAVKMVEALVSRGVDTFFGVPGGPICPFFEAIRLNKSATLIESRHENHAGFAATAYNKATGKVPAVVLTAGPGITNSLSGIASGSMEGASMIVIAGDVAWTTHGGCLAQNSGPEGLNTETMMSSVTRSQVRVTNGRSAVSQTISVFEAATNPTNPGPALIVLPIDRATEKASNLDIVQSNRNVIVEPQSFLVRETVDLLVKAKRPLIVFGGGCVKYHNLVRQVVNAFDVPFITTPRAKGIVNEMHPRSLRNGGMGASLWAREYTSEPVDVALVIGTDLDDTSVGPTPYIGVGGKLIHVDINPMVFNRNMPTHMAITSDIGLFLHKLYDVISTGKLNANCRSVVKSIRETCPTDTQPTLKRGEPLLPQNALAELQDKAPNARFITDIGEHMIFALHYLTIDEPLGFNIQLNLGSMGSGIAGAIGLAMADRGRRIICICGDGGMQMSGMEILTSLKLKLPIVYAVFNDSRYNMVHHGMKQIFGEADEYDTPPVNFANWAASMNIPSQVVEYTGDIDKTLLQVDGPSLLDLRIEKNTRVRGGGRVEALQHMSMLTERT